VAFLDNLEVISNALTDENKVVLERLATAINQHLWTDVPRVATHFTKHEYEHSMAILEILNELCRNDSDFVLSSNEWYILVASAFIHDIGMQCDIRVQTAVFEKLKEELPESAESSPVTDEQPDINYLRTYHSALSKAWAELAYFDSMLFDGSIYNLDRDLISDIYETCDFHSYRAIPIREGLPTSKNTDVDLPKLICLFRLADELDIGEKRCNIKALPNFVIPAENARHWYMNYLSRIKIGKKNVIEYTIHLTHDDYKEHYKVMERVITRFAEKNRTLIWRLRDEFGLFIAFSEINSAVIDDSGERVKLSEEVRDLVYADFDLHYIEPDDGVFLPDHDLSIYVCCDTAAYSDEVAYLQTRLKEIADQQNSRLTINTTDKGRKLATSINMINSSSCVIVISTESFRNQTTSESSSICNELEYIIKTWSDNEDYNDTDRRSRGALYELKFDGDQSLAQLENIDHFVFDFQRFRTIKKQAQNPGPPRMSRTPEKDHFGFMERIVIDGISRSINDSPSYKEYLDSNKTRLLVNTRYENVPLPNDCFVKTKVFEAILSVNDTYIIKGRKGGGKTTILDQIARFRFEANKHKAIISLGAGTLNLHGLFNEFYSPAIKKFADGTTRRRVKSDIDLIVGRVKALGNIWKLFFFMHAAFVVYTEYRNDELSIEQKHRFETIKPLFEETVLAKNFTRWYLHHMRYSGEDIRYKRYSADISSKIYEQSVIKTFFHFNELIDKALATSSTVEEAQSKVHDEFSFPYLLSQELPDEALHGFSDIFKNCTKRIIVTINGFDESFENFIVDMPTVTRDDAANFEAQWFRSLINTIDDIHNSSYKKNSGDIFKILSRKIMLCACLPYDRYSVFLHNNRDSHNYNDRAVSLRWSAPELALLIRKRIEQIPRVKYDLRALWREKDAKNPMTPIETLYFCLEKEYPNIPTEIDVTTSDGNRKMPLFQYVLSKTFWRPRDVLRHFASILSIDRIGKLPPSQIQNLIIRRCSDEAREIINDEFYGEFGNAYRNLRSVMRLFTGRNQLMTYKELYSILGSSEAYIVTYNGIVISEPDELLKFFYEIGVLGIKGTDAFIKKMAMAVYTQDIVFFCEGERPLTFLESRDDEFRKCRFFINPIFSDALNLVENSPEPLCNFSWDYLQAVEGYTLRK